MPKRSRRILLNTKSKKHATIISKTEDVYRKVFGVDIAENEMSTARGRLKGILKDVLEAGEDSDASSDYSPSKRERRSSQDDSKKESSDELEQSQQRRQSPVRQSFVLKLFDRSVDLSQFSEDSPLYPICRAWIANQPKVDYKKFSISSTKEPEEIEDGVDLPGPEGPPVSRIPPLLPEQEARSKDNINLNYREAPPPSRSQLLSRHLARWASVRGAWLKQGAAVEARYSATQELLNRMTANNTE